MTPPVALTIAGSDSGGGAGIQADLRTFAALGVFGTTAITCVTAQNTARVNAVHVLPAAFVRAQIEAVIEDMTVSGAKTGVLYSEEIVREVAALAPSLPALVVDPVLVASTGRRLTDDGAVRACTGKCCCRPLPLPPRTFSKQACFWERSSRPWTMRAGPLAVSATLPLSWW